MVRGSCTAPGIPAAGSRRRAPEPGAPLAARLRSLAATPPAAGRYSVSIGGFNMNSIVYIVGAVVIVLAILGFLGLR
jgi:hypothetical protein